MGGGWGGDGGGWLDDFLKCIEVTTTICMLGGQLAANVFMRHMYAQQENVLYKHRRSTCMRDRDLCYTYTCISHKVKIYRGAHALRARPLCVCSGCEICRYMCSIDLCRACMCCVYACTAHFLVARTCVA